MRRLVVRLLVTLVVLLVVDRVAVWAAQRDVAKRLQADAHTSSTPSVTIHGFPFLTQLVSGTFGDVDIDMHGVHAGGVAISRLTVQVHDAHVSIGDVISQTRSRVHVKRATAQLFITYADLAQVLPAQVRSRATVDHAVITSARVTAPDTISLGTPYGDFPLQLAGLPFGIRLTGAKATQAGLTVDGEAQGLVLPT